MPTTRSVVPVSFASTPESASTVSVPPTATDPESARTTGRTVMVTVAVSVWPASSVTSYVKVTVPDASVAGVYVRAPSSPSTSVPAPGTELSVIVRPVPVSPTSTPSAAGTTSVVFASVVYASSSATGAAGSGRTSNVVATSCDGKYVHRSRPRASPRVLAVPAVPLQAALRLTLPAFAPNARWDDALSYPLTGSANRTDGAEPSNRVVPSALVHSARSSVPTATPSVT